MPLTLDQFEVIKKFPQDGSSRSYARVQMGQGTALFMECCSQDQNVSKETLSNYIHIAEWMCGVGLVVPEIYEADLETGCALIEDFGDVSMKQAVEAGMDEKSLYDQASEILDCLKQQTNLPELPRYHDGPEHYSQIQIADWYIPEKTGRQDRKALAEEYWAVWKDIEADLDPYEEGFLHADFHAENLMVRKDGMLGIIDFQDAKQGPFLYDLGNLLEDMRRNVSVSVQEKLLSNCNKNEKLWCRILTTQFHCRLLGQCIRWRDKDNKPQYMQYIPRLEHYVAEALKDPFLHPLKRWFDDLTLDFRT